MNKTIKRKLILSGLTLAIAGIATTATTYAWFTSNSTVSVTDITGNVAADESIYVKVAGEDNNFGTSASISAEGITFSPVYKKSTDTTTFADVSGNSVDVDAKKYLQFTLTFSGQANTTIGINTATFTRTGTNPGFVLKADAGSVAGVQKGDTLDVSVVDALAMSVLVGGSATNYKVNADADTDYNGLTYYNNVLGGTATTVATDNATYQTTALSSATASSQITLATIPDSGSVDVTFTIYLDGWDKDCFDAITSQTFTAAFTFGVIPAIA